MATQTFSARQAVPVAARAGLSRIARAVHGSAFRATRARVVLVNARVIPDTVRAR
jgi:hypothetical protein